MLRKAFKIVAGVVGAIVLVTALAFVWMVNSAMPDRAASSQPDRISAEYAGCLTKEGLDEFVTAANNNDTRHMQALLGTECISIQGLRFSVVDQGLMNSQIRVYTDEESVLLWTATKATR